MLYNILHQWVVVVIDIIFTLSWDFSCLSHIIEYHQWKNKQV